MAANRVAALCWASALGGLALADLALAQGEADGDTLSEATRDHVPAPVFLTFWAALTAWLPWHLYGKEN